MRKLVEIGKAGILPPANLCSGSSRLELAVQARLFSLYQTVFSYTSQKLPKRNKKAPIFTHFCLKMGALAE